MKGMHGSRRMTVCPIAGVGINVHAVAIGKGGSGHSGANGSVSPVTLYPRVSWVRHDDGGDTSWDTTEMAATNAWYRGLGYKTVFLFNLPQWIESSTLAAKIADIKNIIQPDAVEWGNENDQLTWAVSPRRYMNSLAQARGLGLDLYIIGMSVSGWYSRVEMFGAGNDWGSPSNPFASGCTENGKNWIQQGVALGTDKLLDAIGCHFYTDIAATYDGSHADASISAAGTRFVSEIRALCPGKAIVCTEYGTSTLQAAAAGVTQAAGYDGMRSGSGVPICYYDGVWNGAAEYSLLQSDHETISTLGAAVNAALAAGGVTRGGVG